MILARTVSAKLYVRIFRVLSFECLKKSFEAKLMKICINNVNEKS
jgi:hypothetical protein